MNLHTLKTAIYEIDTKLANESDPRSIRRLRERAIIGREYLLARNRDCSFVCAKLGVMPNNSYVTESLTLRSEGEVVSIKSKTEKHLQHPDAGNSWLRKALDEWGNADSTSIFKCEPFRRLAAYFICEFGGDFVGDDTPPISLAELDLSGARDIRRKKYLVFSALFHDINQALESNQGEISAKQFNKIFGCCLENFGNVLGVNRRFFSGLFWHVPTSLSLVRGVKLECEVLLLNRCRFSRNLFQYQESAVTSADDLNLNIARAYLKILDYENTIDQLARQAARSPRASVSTFGSSRVKIEKKIKMIRDRFHREDINWRQGLFGEISVSGLAQTIKPIFQYYFKTFYPYIENNQGAIPELLEQKFKIWNNIIKRLIAAHDLYSMRDELNDILLKSRRTLSEQRGFFHGPSTKSIQVLERARNQIKAFIDNQKREMDCGTVLSRS